MNTLRPLLATAICILGVSVFPSDAFSQPETNPSGGLRGIRVDGELLPITTGIRAVPTGESPLGPISGEKLGPAGRLQFTRQGTRVTTSGGVLGVTVPGGARGAPGALGPGVRGPAARGPAPTPVIVLQPEIPALDEVKTRLSLTDQQATQIAPILEEVAKARSGVASAQADNTAFRNEEIAKLTAILNDAQKPQLTQLLVPPGIGNRGGFAGNPGGRGPRGGGGPLNAQIAYDDGGSGLVHASVQVTVGQAAVPMDGTYYFIHLPGPEFAGAKVDLFESEARDKSTPGETKRLRITAAHRQFELNLPEYRKITVTDKPATAIGGGGFDVYFPVTQGNLDAGATASLSFTMKATGDIDNAPVQFTLDPGHPGSPFDGVGGNFRMQGAQDPAQVAYNLANLRVPWARVNLPLDQWQPNENDDLAAGPINAQVVTALQMEQTLAKKGIPIVMTVWAIPRWANGRMEPRPPDSGGPGQGSAYHLDPTKWEEVCQSIVAYLDYAKANYGVDPTYFSFNETDIGYNVLQTPQEQTEEIKQLGAYFAAHGVKAKLFLGDTGDPTGYPFIENTMADPEALKYVGAVSFHSWRGGTDEQFIKWGEDARKLHVPLFVGEGGIDSDASSYQNVLYEPWYSLVEISEYVNICRLAQPQAILHWQLTENYTLLKGGRNGAPLEPAQRFYQLKQLNLTPAGSASLPIKCDRPNLIYAAFAGPTPGAYAVHLINNGAARAATVSGFPAGVKEVRVIVTDATRGMKELDRVPVSNGSAQVTLDSMSYVTLLSGI